MWCQHREYIAHLEHDIDWLKRQLLHERARAELAVDKLQMMQVGGGPITPPAEDGAGRAEIEALLSNPDFQAAGGIEAVDDRGTHGLE